MPSLMVGTKVGLFLVDLQRGGAAGAREEQKERVTALAVRDSDVWAAFDGAALHHRDPDGSWSPLPWVDERFSMTCLLPTRSGVWVGTAGAHLLRLEGERPATLESFEQIEGRADWYTPWGGPPDTRSLSADGAGAVYVNVHVGGILRSTDGGGTWQQTIDIHSDVHEVVAGPADGMVLAATALGMAASRDRGETWEFIDRGLHATYSRAVAVVGESVFLSASEGPGGRRSAVYRAPLALDGPFVRCTDGLPEWFGSNIDTGCVVAAGDMVVVGTAGGSVFGSADQGERWEEIAGGLPPVTCLAYGPGEA
jgi:hypothetical protein